MRDHGDIAAERDGVVATVLAGGDGVDDAIALLDTAEDAAGSPLVDEAERERLQALANGTVERAEHWHSLLAMRGGTAAGYAGVTLPRTAGEPAEADVAVARDLGPCHPVLAVLLAGLESLARSHTVGLLQVWIRHVEAADITCATDEGYAVDRRLAVLGRPLDDEPVAVPDAPGYRVRSYRADLDDAAVVEVLRETYAGTADAGWDLARFGGRRGWSWFRPEDLLVAVDEAGRIGGLHWLKRRTAVVGEVYNLAIHPRAQGRGLGRMLLVAGLDHLRRVGCHDVLLWVDLANERAVRLYTSEGFTTRWEDVALFRTLHPSRPG